MESIFIITAVAGAVEFLKRLEVRDYRTCAVIAAAAGIGALAGVFSIDGLSVTEGVIAGLAASGTVTVASKVG